MQSSQLVECLPSVNLAMAMAVNLSHPGRTMRSRGRQKLPQRSTRPSFSFVIAIATSLPSALFRDVRFLLRAQWHGAVIGLADVGAKEAITGIMLV